MLLSVARQEAHSSIEAGFSSLLMDALDALADHVALLSPQGLVVAVNRAWQEFAVQNGYVGEEVGLGTKYDSMSDRAEGPGSEEAASAARLVREVLSGELEGGFVDYPCHAPHEERWFRMTVRSLSSPGPVRAIVTHTNITAEKVAARETAAALAAVQLERAGLAALFDEAPAFLAVMRGPDYRFERVNPAYLQLVGHRDPVGLTLREAFPELADQGFVPLLDAVRETGVPFSRRHMPVRLARLPGMALELRYVDLVYLRLAEADGDYSVVAYGVDVTGHVRSTQRLNRTKQQLREQFAKLPVPTFLFERREATYRLLDCNMIAESVMPRAPGASTSPSIDELFPGVEGLLADLDRCLQDDVVIRRSITAEVQGDHARRSFELTIGAQQPDRVLLHAVDTTAHTRLEAQLRQSQKMEAVGRLAGGVAHDFNNLLTVIGAHSAFLLESLGSHDPQREDAQAIHDAGVRAAGLTRQLLAFSRKQMLKPAVVDLNALVQDARRMLARLISEDIRIDVVLDPALGSVVADSTQIDQVLVNLAVNARDAMPEGGTLTIATRNVVVPDRSVESSGLVPDGQYVLLEVHDTGLGMDAAVKSRLFEPFFTTKAPGKGTGLGLATAYGIIKQSGGYIIAESEPGEGSVFRVFLPQVAHHDASQELRTAEGAAVRGVETILVVEDEATVRSIAVRLLTRKGYVVLEAANGDEALALSAQYAGPIHLVLSDAVMPGMSGPDTVRRLRDQRPELRVVFMSGHTDDEVLRRGIVSDSVLFVQKPFSPDTLTRIVRDALDSPAVR